MNRAGRFDRAYEIKMPSEALRLEYLQLRGFSAFVGEEGTATAARLTGDFSLTQLGELYVSAALEWHENGTAEVELLVRGDARRAGQRPQTGMDEGCFVQYRLLLNKIRGEQAASANEAGE
ncbi:hypothetical protein ACFTAO_06535 [Paenibacillus rhizoplanae]